MKIKVNGIDKEYKIRNGLICPVISDIFSLKEKIREYRIDRVTGIKVVSNTNDLNNPIFDVVIEFIDCITLQAKLDLLELGHLNSTADINRRKEPWTTKWLELNSYVDRPLEREEMIEVLKYRWSYRKKCYSFFLIVVGALISFACYLAGHKQVEYGILFFSPFFLFSFFAIFLLRRKCSNCLSSLSYLAYPFERQLLQGQIDKK